MLKPVGAERMWAVFAVAGGTLGMRDLGLDVRTKRNGPMLLRRRDDTEWIWLGRRSGRRNFTRTHATCAVIAMQAAWLRQLRPSHPVLSRVVRPRCSRATYRPLLHLYYANHGNFVVHKHTTLLFTRTITMVTGLS